MSDEKRIKKPPRIIGSLIKWSISRGRRMWYEGVPIKQMAVLLSTPEHKVTEQTIKAAARRYGWRARKIWTPKPELPITVLRRCHRCGAHYPTGRDWLPHENCGEGVIPSSIYVEAA